MNRSGKIHQITLTAILMAVILLMAYTPLGYLRLGMVEITFLTIPVVIGAIVLGPWWGAFLGAVFGATSFAQCFSTSVFGAALLSINPFYTFVVCMVPRILIGLVAGFLFRLLHKVDKAGIISFVITAISGALTNTVFFVGLVVFFFKDTYFGGSAFWPIFLSFFTLNVVLEVLVCGVISAALSKVMVRLMLKK